MTEAKLKDFIDKLLDDDIPQVDIIRCDILNQMTREQQCSFGIGLGFYSAFLTAGRQRAGSDDPPSDIRAAIAVRDMLKELNFLEIAKELEF
ncbi:MAG: hypothetical protein QQN63_00725 [Nitrosopumilus sp.]